MKKKEVIKFILELLAQEEVFKGYSILSSQNMLIKDSGDVLDISRLELKKTYNFEDENDLNDYYELKIDVVRQFKLLHEWSFKYSFISKADLKYRWSLLEQNLELVIFPKKDSYDSDDLKVVVDAVKKYVNMVDIPGGYPDLKAYYLKYEQPLLRSCENITAQDLVFSNISKYTLYGFDWIIETLLLAFMFNRELYDDLKIKLTKHFKKICSNDEPNAVQYPDKFEDILKFNEKLVLSLDNL
ncbi:MAG: hypothetical protein ACO1N0_05350 [Fluviicola sp.]